MPSQDVTTEDDRQRLSQPQTRGFTAVQVFVRGRWTGSRTTGVQLCCAAGSHRPRHGCWIALHSGMAARNLTSTAHPASSRSARVGANHPRPRPRSLIMPVAGDAHSERGSTFSLHDSVGMKRPAHHRVRGPARTRGLDTCDARPQRGGARRRTYTTACWRRSVQDGGDRVDPVSHWGHMVALRGTGSVRTLRGRSAA
jgi:hypothetical protein